MTALDFFVVGDYVVVTTGPLHGQYATVRAMTELAVKIHYVDTFGTVHIRSISPHRLATVDPVSRQVLDMFTVVDRLKRK